MECFEAIKWTWGKEVTKGIGVNSEQCHVLRVRDFVFDILALLFV